MRTNRVLIVSSVDYYNTNNYYNTVRIIGSHYFLIFYLVHYTFVVLFLSHICLIKNVVNIVYFCDSKIF